MNLFMLHSPIRTIRKWQRLCTRFLLLLLCLFFLGMPSALAGIKDDRFEGNVFVLYGGNASLVPAKINLEGALQQNERATVLVLYLDDSSDCKQYAPVVSRLQAFYGRATYIIPVNVDSIRLKSTYTPTEAGYYYQGVLPQIVVFNQAGKVVLNEKGQVPYEQIDDTLREVFDLLPRSESVELKRRHVNELSSELAK